MDTNSTENTPVTSPVTDAPPPVISQPAPTTSKPSFLKSRKSAVLVLIIILVAGGIFALSKSTPPPTPTPPVEVAKQVVPLFLTLESPVDGAIIKENTLTISGKTTPQTTVVFFTESEDGSVESDASGTFSGTLPLQNGINTVTVTAFGENGEEKTTTLDVVYDEEANSTL